MKRICFIIFACSWFAACAQLGDVYAVQSQAWGMSAQSLPDGTIKGNLGMIEVDFIGYPAFDKAGNPILVDDLCGTKQYPSLFATNQGRATGNVNVATSKAISNSLSGQQGIAIGTSAEEESMADMLNASNGSNGNPNPQAAAVITAYRTCPSK